MTANGIRVFIVREDNLEGEQTRSLLALAELHANSPPGAVSLETGRGAAFEPALAMYRSRGFVDGAAFSDYRENDFSQFLHLRL
jgi:hypothetical protein